jgi:hypothetical protein
MESEKIDTALLCLLEVTLERDSSDSGANYGVRDIVYVVGTSYFNRSVILLIPATAQASSFSPPGAPLTPIAPIT